MDSNFQFFRGSMLEMCFKMWTKEAKLLLALLAFGYPVTWTFKQIVK